MKDFTLEPNFSILLSIIFCQEICSLQPGIVATEHVVSRTQCISYILLHQVNLCEIIHHKIVTSYDRERVPVWMDTSFLIVLNILYPSQILRADGVT